jgi:hypothetical protein
MRLLDNLAGLNEEDFYLHLRFYIHCYHKILKGKNKNTMLHQLRELRHDLRMQGVIIPELDFVYVRIEDVYV